MTRKVFALALGISLAAAAGLYAFMGDPPRDEGKAATTRVGDPYPLDDCPVSGRKFSSPERTVIRVYEGREVRFCCAGCPEKFAKDRPASFAKLDAQLVKDQLPLYPLTTSVVSGKPLPEKSVDYFYGNRLVRLAEESEKAEFQKSPEKYIERLNEAAIEKQLKDYTLDTCPISGQKIGPGAGDATNIVLAGRLIRLCCLDCKAEVDKQPAKYIAMVDAARGRQAGDAPKPAEPEKKGG